MYGTLSIANAGQTQTDLNSSSLLQNSTSTNVETIKDGGWPEEIVEEYAKVGGTPWIRPRHVFRTRVEGMDVVLKIEGVESVMRKVDPARKCCH